MANVLSMEELQQLRSFKEDFRARVMAMYLIGDGNRRYNMQEVAEMFWHDENRKFTVSLFTRAYGFSGQNSGRYGAGSRFAREHGFAATYDDVYAFVCQYPQGTYDLDISFDDFLVRRHQQRTYTQPMQQGYTQPRQRTQTRARRDESYDYTPSEPSRSYSGGGRSRSGMNRPIKIVAIVAVIALAVIFIWAFVTGGSGFFAGALFTAFLLVLSFYVKKGVGVFFTLCALWSVTHGTYPIEQEIVLVILYAAAGLITYIEVDKK